MRVQHSLNPVIETHSLCIKTMSQNHLWWPSGMNPRIEIYTLHYYDTVLMQWTLTMLLKFWKSSLLTKSTWSMAR